VYSLNVPVPGPVSKLAADLATPLRSTSATVRRKHTLVGKRLGGGDHHAYHRLEARARDALRATTPFAARISRVELFEDVPQGAAPVVYLAVESPGLEQVHQELAAEFDLVADVEGDNYVPHVTIARGGLIEVAREVAAADVEPIEWTVDELVFWDAEREQPVTRLSLPA
jgi:2'-5' RNA ligase